MPLSVPHYPSLSLGLLKPVLHAIGERCEVRYFSLDYVDHIGAESHACLTDVAYYMAHVGEWVFSGAAHGHPDGAGLSFLVECFAREYPAFNTAARLSTFLRARRSAPDFIERCLESVDWRGYDIIGFTTSFQQTMASLALARRIKQLRPNILIAFGGVNCQDQMGRALLRQYEFIDAVCLGEGERSFPELVRRFRGGDVLDGIAGMAVRPTEPDVRPVPSTDAAADMDSLPYPDYDDFFDQHARTADASAHTPAVVFETARGCWWGERHNCTFCGLNGMTMTFRAKSQERAYEELQYLVRRHGCRDAANADKILDQRYFDKFIPRLAESGLDLTIYYEAKVGLSPDQIAMLARSGIRKVQFGIETLNTDLLRLIAKGTTMLQNIEVLKLSAENGIYVEWLALSGFPGERPEHYERLAQVLSKLFHLQPPAAFIRARGDRFSPYERDPDRYGVRLEPLPAYRHIFPFDDQVVRSLANHFVLCSPALARHDDYVAGAAQQYALWQARKPGSRLWYEDVDEGTVVVHDTRGQQVEDISPLHGASAALLRLCWRITRWTDAVPALKGRYTERTLAEAAAQLEARSFLVREGSRCLTLALRQPGFRGAPSWPEVRARRELA
ncbi:MAG: RiPP maturation radical SAM C-methyltransferase [Pseudomonadota bacterium]|nr:RiPP maturation radical SAM C-methyltransferase [Pseudomonadota bacterium]